MSGNCCIFAAERYKKIRLWKQQQGLLPLRNEHEQFVQMFRAAKQRKQEWQKKMGVVLAEKAEKIRKRRAEIDKLFDDK